MNTASQPHLRKTAVLLAACFKRSTVSRKTTKSFSKLPGIARRVGFEKSPALPKFPRDLRASNRGLPLKSSIADCTMQVALRYRMRVSYRIRLHQPNTISRTLPANAPCPRHCPQYIVEESSFNMQNHSRDLHRLALIGMSGAGKTFWSRQLSGAGYQPISCDEQIEARLASKLTAGAFTGINGVAAWMGWPDSATYAERESQYLAEEIATLDEALRNLEKNPSNRLVLDTTGSVIYTGNNLLMRLRRYATIIYLAASEKECHLLIDRYLSDPKPVLWRGAFQPRTGESARETVARCYPALLASRRQSYEALAHCTIPISGLREIPQTAEAFLDRVHQALQLREASNPR
jgi:shikimate kinase